MYVRSPSSYQHWVKQAITTNSTYLFAGSFYLPLGSLSLILTPIRVYVAVIVLSKSLKHKLIITLYAVIWFQVTFFPFIFRYTGNMLSSIYQTERSL